MYHKSYITPLEEIPLGVYVSQKGITMNINFGKFYYKVNLFFVSLRYFNTLLIMKVEVS